MMNFSAQVGALCPHLPRGGMLLHRDYNSALNRLSSISGPAVPFFFRYTGLDRNLVTG